MTEKENNNHPTIIINNAKNERFREKLKITIPLVTKIAEEKIKNFQKAVKVIKNDENFLFKAVQEINEQLTKDNEGFLIGFSSKFHEFFKQQTMFYWRINGYITEDEILGINLVDEDFYCLDQVIKQNTDDKEFIPWVKNLKADLPLVYIDAY